MSEWEYLRSSPPLFWDRAPEQPQPTGWRRFFKSPADMIEDHLERTMVAWPTAEDINNWLNDLGRQGWELVSQKSDTYTFKREKGL